VSRIHAPAYVFAQSVWAFMLAERTDKAPHTLVDDNDDVEKKSKDGNEDKDDDGEDNTGKKGVGVADVVGINYVGAEDHPIALRDCT
jgi:hypothetical protein